MGAFIKTQTKISFDTETQEEVLILAVHPDMKTLSSSRPLWVSILLGVIAQYTKQSKAFLTLCVLFVVGIPLSEPDESGLVLRQSGDLIEYVDQSALVKRIPQTVFTSTLSLLQVFTIATCTAAFVSAGANVPADIACVSLQSLIRLLPISSNHRLGLIRHRFIGVCGMGSFQRHHRHKRY